MSATFLHHLRTPINNAEYTVWAKKVSHKTQTITLSNLNRFSIFIIIRQSIKLSTRPMQHFPPHLNCVSALRWENK